MSERGLSPASRHFLEAHLTSLLHVEILLLLRRDPAQWLKAPVVAARLGVSEGTAERVLEQLGAANLTDVRIRSSLSFRFAPTESAVLPLIDEIAAVHHDDRQAFETLLARRRESSGAARIFADAFRWPRRIPRA